MYTADAGGDAFNPAVGRGFDSAPQALATWASTRPWTSPGTRPPSALNGLACGELLIALGEVQAKLTSPRTSSCCNRFDAANAVTTPTGTARHHRGWPRGRGMPEQGRQGRGPARCRQPSSRPLLGAALAAGGTSPAPSPSPSPTGPGKLPAPTRDETDRILLGAAAAGASTEDPATHRRVRGSRHGARSTSTWTAPTRMTGTCSSAPRSAIAGVILPGDPDPWKVRTGVRAKLEALGKKTGPGRRPDRGAAVPRRAAARLVPCCHEPGLPVPARAGADTQAVVHIPLSQPAPAARSARARRAPGSAPGLGLCRTAISSSAPPCSGRRLRRTERPRRRLGCHGPRRRRQDDQPGPGLLPPRRRATTIHPPAGATTAIAGHARARSAALSPQAWRALRYAMACLVVDLVSGPAGRAAAAILRQGRSDKPYRGHHRHSRWTSASPVRLFHLCSLSLIVYPLSSSCRCVSSFPRPPLPLVSP